MFRYSLCARVAALAALTGGFLTLGTACEEMPDIGVGTEICLGSDNWEFCTDFRICKDGSDEDEVCNAPGFYECYGTGAFAKDWCPGYASAGGDLSLQCMVLAEFDSITMRFQSDAYEDDDSWSEIVILPEYVQPDGTIVVSTPNAAPSGVIEAAGSLHYGSMEVPLFSEDFTTLDCWAYNSYPWEVYTDRRDSSDGPYLYVDLDKMVD